MRGHCSSAREEWPALCRAACGSPSFFFLITEMIVPGSFYWNTGIRREPGEVEKDEEGIRTMKVPGRNMTWLLTLQPAGGDRMTSYVHQKAVSPDRFLHAGRRRLGRR